MIYSAIESRSPRFHPEQQSGGSQDEAVVAEPTISGDQQEPFQELQQREETESGLLLLHWMTLCGGTVGMRQREAYVGRD